MAARSVSGREAARRSVYPERLILPRERPPAVCCQAQPADRHSAPRERALACLRLREAWSACRDAATVPSSCFRRQAGPRSETLLEFAVSVSVSALAAAVTVSPFGPKVSARAQPVAEFAAPGSWSVLVAIAWHPPAVAVVLVLAKSAVSARQAQSSPREVPVAAYGRAVPQSAVPAAGCAPAVQPWGAAAGSDAELQPEAAAVAASDAAAVPQQAVGAAVLDAVAELQQAAGAAEPDAAAVPLLGVAAAAVRDAEEVLRPGAEPVAWARRPAAAPWVCRRGQPLPWPVS